MWSLTEKTLECQYFTNTGIGWEMFTAFVKIDTVFFLSLGEKQLTQFTQNSFENILKWVFISQISTNQSEFTTNAVDTSTDTCTNQHKHWSYEYISALNKNQNIIFEL